MAEFKTTNMTAGCIEEMIADAEKKLVFISPYLQIDPRFIERLVQAGRRGVQVTVVHGKTDLLDEQREPLAQIRGLKLYFCERLHAKCYFSEKALLVSSMNLYEYSVHNNFEMSILVRPAEDGKVYADAVREAETIIAASKLERAPSAFGSFAPRAKTEGDPFSSNRFDRPAQKSTDRGYCLRCCVPLPLNPGRPFCSGCFAEWDSYGNWDYIEKYCHVCGRRAETSREEPVCARCR